MNPVFPQIDDYLLFLTDQKAVSDSTRATYKGELQRAMRARLLDATPEGVARFISDGPKGCAAPATRNRRLFILRGFFKYLQSNGEIDSDPTAPLRSSRIPRSDKTPPSVGELDRIMKVVRSVDPSWRRTRDETLLTTLYYTGLRIQELLALDVEQVDVQGRILLASKRKRGARINSPISERAATQLAIWLAERPAGGDERALFVGVSHRRLGVRRVQIIFKQLRAQAGVSAKTNPHNFRHAHATQMSRSGADISIVQRSLNHSSVKTTMRYVHSDDEVLRAALDAMPALKRES